ncbi:unnamed protein product [Thlaspi arvense]|uniref:BHLH domain-containing protein n=1 Tax=Thlaspi arvense TaxID=13288 RepID=A0AAU9RY37_THLAR|nr:unnamed protein product [Thlaspi arvense]
MSHFVPDFDTDDDHVNVHPNSSSLNLPVMGEEDHLMELLWQNGQVVLQNQRLNNNAKKTQAAPPPPMQQDQQQPLDQSLFIQEDEMTSWLRDDDFCSDLLFSAPPTAACQVTAARPPPVPPLARPPVRNFANFSRLRGDFTRVEPGPSISKAAVRESTQASSSSAASESGLTRRTDGIDSRGTVNRGFSSVVAGGGAVAGLNRKGKAVATTAHASEIPGASSKIEIEPVNEQLEKTVADDRKRKGREDIEETDECRSEETKQQGRGSTKRCRAAEVHNLSERKRRDRINERMKALQELIPRCNKSDKASMLDEAIEYMKSLQLQIQMMSMGCGMMPMMYTGMQQYMAMGMGMNRPPPPPFMPFPNMLASQRPLPHMGSSYSDPSRLYVSNQQFDPGYMDPYQQFRSLHPAQQPQSQNQVTSYPSSSRVSSSKEESEDQGNQTTG